MQSLKKFHEDFVLDTGAPRAPHKSAEGVPPHRGPTDGVVSAADRKKGPPRRERYQQVRVDPIILSEFHLRYLFLFRRARRTSRISRAKSSSRRTSRLRVPLMARRLRRRPSRRRTRGKSAATSVSSSSSSRREAPIPPPSPTRTRMVSHSSHFAAH